MKNCDVKKIKKPENFDTREFKPRTLFIGYKHNYPNTIRNALCRANLNCEYLLLDQNVELYRTELNKEDPLYKMVVNTIENGHYDVFVIDITNLYLFTKYKNTKRLLKYIKSKGKKMIILSADPIWKFQKIFGKTYAKLLIERNYLIRLGDHEITKRKILSIL